MSELKCPVCNSELVGTIGHPICRNQDCVMCDDPMPQYLLEALIRTRKALDVAVDALKRIKEPTAWGTLYQEQEIATEALDESKTALEQKKSAFVHNKIEFPEYNDNLLEEFDKEFFENGQDDDLTETALEQKDK